MGARADHDAGQDRDGASAGAAAPPLARVQPNPGGLRPDAVPSDFAVVFALSRRGALSAERVGAFAMTVAGGGAPRSDARWRKLLRFDLSGLNYYVRVVCQADTSG